MLSRFKVVLCLVMLSSFVFSKKLKEGNYRGILFLDETNKVELPFNFEVKYSNKKPLIIIKNGDERIEVTEITVKKDSLWFKMPVFDTEFRCMFTKEGLEGEWINHYRVEKNRIRFKAEYKNNQRFEAILEKSFLQLEGKWAVNFSPEKKQGSPAIGVFHHIEQSNFITGTFLTETGDYRFLEGVFSKNTLFLSSFDGSHAFLFVASLLPNSQLKGKFYSGSHWQEDWIASKNDTIQLKNPEEITYAIDKTSPVNFSFQNLNKQVVSLSDTMFKNKAIIVQIMGSWCPNCMDESKYLSELYAIYKPKNLEIVALAYEKTTDFEKARGQVLRLKNKLNIPYEILITQLSGKEKASETLPFLNKVSAFPTTLFLDKAHRVVKVHTGFSGPATGKEYETFKTNTEQLVQRLLLD